MKLTYCVSIFVIKILFLILPGQPYAQAPDTCWTRCYGGDSADLCDGIEATPDGGCVLVGSTKSFGNGKYDVFLIKVNALGNAQWMQTYGGSDDDYGYDVKITRDNGYLITGKTQINQNMGSDIFVIKTDSIGDTIWTRVIGGIYGDWGISAVVLDDNSAVIAATSESFTMDSTDMVVMKIEANGNINWFRTHDIRNFDDAKDIDIIYNNGFYLFGNTRDTTESSMCLLRLDNNGDTVWTRCFDPQITTGAYNAAEMITMSNDGAMMIFTSSRMGGSHINVMFTDSGGDTLWWHGYGNGIYDNGRSITFAADGTILIGGDCFFITEDSLYLAKIDVNGSRIWEVGYGNNDGFIFGGHVSQCSDGGFFLAGTQTAQNNNDICLIKYRSESEIYEHPPIIEKPFQISSCPNPFTENVFITIMATDNLNKIMLKICDATGRTVKQFVHLPNNQFHNCQIIWDGCDMHDKSLPGGIYFVVTETSIGQAFGKIILIR